MPVTLCHAFLAFAFTLLLSMSNVALFSILSEYLLYFFFFKLPSLIVHYLVNPKEMMLWKTSHYLQPCDIFLHIYCFLFYFSELKHRDARSFSENPVHHSVVRHHFKLHFQNLNNYLSKMLQFLFIFQASLYDL